MKSFRVDTRETIGGKKNENYEKRICWENEKFAQSIIKKFQKKVKEPKKILEVILREIELFVGRASAGDTVHALWDELEDKEMDVAKAVGLLCKFVKELRKDRDALKDERTLPEL